MTYEFGVVVVTMEDGKRRKAKPVKSGVLSREVRDDEILQSIQRGSGKVPVESWKSVRLHH